MHHPAWGVDLGLQRDFVVFDLFTALFKCSLLGIVIALIEPAEDIIVLPDITSYLRVFFDSIETGLRTNRPGWSAEIALFYMHKRDSVFRDTDGFNISGARSRHRGVPTASLIPQNRRDNYPPM